MKYEILRMQNITKYFPGVVALDNVNLTVFKGEVLALVGENGAGKSTLMKILSGVYQKDLGKIYFEGKEVYINSPTASQELGMSIIHQELNLMPNLSIYENIFMGRENRSKLIFMDRSRSYKLAMELLETVGLHINADTLVKELSISQRQMVEIAKALSLNAKLIIMDEPTSSLTEKETETLKNIIRKLCSQQVSVVYISHKLDEVLELADRVTALRDGNTVGTITRAECTKDKIIRMMVGRELKDIFPRSERNASKEVLRVENISTTDLLKNVSFTLQKGEILGFAGLVGAGRTELMKVIFGLDQKVCGRIYVNGSEVEIHHPKDALRYKLALVPEDRKIQGLVLGMSVRENITLSILDKVSKINFIKRNMESYIANDFIKKLNVKTPGAEQKVGNLSGGNQQKIVISKMLATQPQILILDEPTRGVDIGAKKEIHTMIDGLAQQGLAVIIISSELGEVLGMSDRIIVMHEGEIKGEISGEEATQEKIMHMAINQ
ncbi:sugar ABC transporter ATP-binding protein [Desulfosporosinus sp. BICA1-9]|uniref:sugar ABC transporter ATP-binding protein n=1 Tax=Desulfosporosinus sp. BICA1-9 TaxID=1531958 RepID=UPI00054C6092|nr:sugar ABC transporter ATP-binding protein [Desulfosporosinus sp. BICA1-9]KJS50571.1 MAG: D-ribose transporter ATP-binding protein [Peptococcaceae bacterium BRH_c23]KJS82838.1 MAG: D-ribose transporter ATP-binding protein [Desulfosporosinus sp. BICA1-9]